MLYTLALYTLVRPGASSPFQGRSVNLSSTVGFRARLVMKTKFSHDNSCQMAQFYCLIYSCLQFKFVTTFFPFTVYLILQMATNKNCKQRERLSVTNLSSENNLPTFRVNAPVVIRVKVKEVQTNIAVYSHALLRIHIIGGQRSVRITPPFLPPHHSGPANNLSL